MNWTLFIIGVLVAMGGFGNVFTHGPHTFRAGVLWMLSGFGGAGLAVLAIYLRHWGF